jgi:predicted ArsR family transcriptional regulator
VAFDQHPNTVRAHLEALVGAGLVLRERVPGPGRGRPAWHYRANPAQPEPDPRVREYDALAGALAAHIAAHSPDPAAEGRSAGERWGRALVAAGQGARPERPEPAGTRAPSGAAPSAVEARRRVLRLLEELDFSPRPNRAATRATLTTCPLLDVASRHPGVVCSVHEGMVVGALASLGAPSDGVALTPFGAPEGCVLVMSGAAAPPRQPQAAPVPASVRGVGGDGPRVRG